MTITGLFGLPCATLPSQVPSVLTRGRGFKTSLTAVCIDRNDAAKPTERPGRRWRMSKLLP
jgi:hypothetical protein